MSREHEIDEIERINWIGSTTLSKPSVLGKLVGRVMETVETVRLTKAESQRFYREFSAHMAPIIDNLRRNRLRMVVLNIGMPEMFMQPCSNPHLICRGLVMLPENREIKPTSQTQNNRPSGG